MRLWGLLRLNRLRYWRGFYWGRLGYFACNPTATTNGKVDELYHLGRRQEERGCRDIRSHDDQATEGEHVNQHRQNEWL
jgi:hypothetical protein